MADRLGPINPSGFVANTPIVVEPRAVQALTDAFRSGQIRADEIADRAMLRPAQKAAASLAAEPSIVEAKRQEILTGAESAKIKLEADKLALEQAKQQANIPAIIRDQNKELATKGLQVFPDTGGTWTPEKSAEVAQLWKDLKNWEAEFSSAVAQDKSLKEVDITTDAGVEKISYEEGSQRRADPGRAASIKDWIRTNASPRQWIQSGKPPSPTLFGPAPGQVAGVPPEVASGQRAPGFDAQMTPLPGTAPAPAVTPAAPASAIPATPGGLLVKPAGVDRKAPTEPQAKAATAVARMITADEVLNNLQQKGFNPSATTNWVQDYLVGPLEALKTADKKTYDTAAGSWIQGLLRLESGAAIAAKEQKWYEQTFFPRPGDTPAVQQIKSEMRDDVEAIVQELARGGGLNVPALIGVRKQGETLNATAAAGVPTRQTTVGGKTYNVVEDPSGRVKLVPVGAPATAVQPKPYQQPDRLGGGSGGKNPVKVERKDTKSLRGF